MLLNGVTGAMGVLGSSGGVGAFSRWGVAQEGVRLGLPLRGRGIAGGSVVHGTLLLEEWGSECGHVF